MPARRPTNPPKAHPLHSPAGAVPKSSRARRRPMAPGAGPEREQQASRRRRQEKRRPSRPRSPQGGCRDLSPRLLLPPDAPSMAAGWMPPRPDTDLGAPARSLRLSQPFVPLAGKRAPAISSAAALQLHGTDCPEMRALVLGSGRVTLGPAAGLWVGTPTPASVKRSHARALGSLGSGRRLNACGVQDGGEGQVEQLSRARCPRGDPEGGAGSGGPLRSDVTRPGEL